MAPAPIWYERLFRFVSAGAPFVVAVARASSAGQWRGDLPSVRDLGLVSVGFGGGISTAVAQAMSLLPLGSRTFRGSLASALGLAVAAALLFETTRRLLHARSADTPGAPGASRLLAAFLAAIATLTAALSPAWQQEATVPGGAMWAVSAALAALLAGEAWLGADGRSPRAVAAAIVTGALVGAAFAESIPAALAVVFGLGARLALARVGAWRRAPRFVARALRLDGSAGLAPPPAGSYARAALAAAIAAALLAAPLALRPLAPRAWADVGRLLSAASLSELDVASARTTALDAWAREVGFVSLAVAALGVVTSLRGPASRRAVAPLLVALALDTALPARARGMLSADPLAAIRALALAAVAVGSAAGVDAAIGLLLAGRHRLLRFGGRSSALASPPGPFARSAALLVVVFHLTLVALTSEEAGVVADRSGQYAAEEWTDEGLARTDPGAAVLVRSPALAWRLWAARLLRGERPDVIVVPTPLLYRGRVAARLGAAAPELEPLLRDYALTGEPSEFALSKLADARPLYVELDRTWPKRIVNHLLVAGMWLEFAPQPLGASDRKTAASGAVAPIGRVVAAVDGGGVRDGSTASILASTLRGHAAAMTLVGDPAAASAFALRLDEIDGAGAPAGEAGGLRGGVAKHALGDAVRAAVAAQASSGTATLAARAARTTPSPQPRQRVSTK